MTFLETSDGLVAARYIIAIGKPESWPHGIFHKITYQVGREAWETRASKDDVSDFLDSEE
jgi:hypothetical protein